MSEKITIKEIACRAQTSKTTVSFYLNGRTDKMSEETRQRIAKVIEETNYRPSVAARLLNAKETKLIGVIIGDITNSFANQIVKGIDDIAREKRYQLIVGNSNYILENEDGASLRASGFSYCYTGRGGSWNQPGRPRTDQAPTCPKQLYEIILNRKEEPEIAGSNQHS